MCRLVTFALGSVLIALFSLSTNANPSVILHTNAGAITIELYPDKAPETVANFLAYARDGFYDGTIFHRVVKRFVVQTGGFTKDMVEKPTRDPIINESGNGLHNDRWTVAMARLTAPNSATSQFYINVSANSSLDGRGDKPGYAVFGMVTDGQHVVREISLRETHNKSGHSDVPVQPVIIERVEVKEAP